MNTNHPENNRLWELLGSSAPVTVSPFFARNVLRTIRSSKPEMEFFHCTIRWLVAPTFSLLALAFTLSLINSHSAHIPSELVDYYDIAAGIDQFAMLEENSVLLTQDL